MNKSFKWTLSTSQQPRYIFLSNSLSSPRRIFHTFSSLRICHSAAASLVVLKPCSHCCYLLRHLFFLPQYKKVFPPASTPGSVLGQDGLHHLTRVLFFALYCLIIFTHTVAQM